jgi:hypothetical protein
MPPAGDAGDVFGWIRRGRVGEGRSCCAVNAPASIWLLRRSKSFTSSSDQLGRGKGQGSGNLIWY